MKELPVNSNNLSLPPSVWECMNPFIQFDFIELERACWWCIEFTEKYSTQTLTWLSWIDYMDCWIPRIGRLSYNDSTKVCYSLFVQWYNLPVLHICPIKRFTCLAHCPIKRFTCLALLSNKKIQLVWHFCPMVHLTCLAGFSVDKIHLSCWFVQWFYSPVCLICLLIQFTCLASLSYDKIHLSCEFIQW